MFSESSSSQENIRHFAHLNYNIGRVDEHAYHLEHERTQNSWYHNPHMQRNNQLWEELKVLSKEDLIKYYKQQEYYKNRV